MEDNRQTRLSGPGSILGQLQRGRGEGFLAALRLPQRDAADLVWQCIVHDPRIDRQVETRAGYYAHLATEVGLGIERLRPKNCPVSEPYDDQRLVIGVLGVLAEEGLDKAGEVLLEHVSQGTEWDDAIYAISCLPGGWSRRLPELLEQRFSEAQCEDVVRRWRREVPWDEVSGGYPWVARAVASHDERKSEVAARRSEPPSMSCSAKELLAHEWHGALPKLLLHRLTVMVRPGERDILMDSLAESGSNRRIAFQALARLDDPGGIAVAERILVANESGRDRAEAVGYMRGLSAEYTLDIARQWVERSDGRATAARMIFERHAESRDIPLLSDGLEMAWGERDFYALCSYLDALARLRPAAALDQMVVVYQEAECSYARSRAARAIHAVDRDLFSRGFARSALWDCETEIQEMAMETSDSPTDTIVRNQLSRLAALRDELDRKRREAK